MIQNVILTRNAVVTLNVVIKSVKKRWVTDTTSLSVLIPVWLDQILFELSALIKNPIFVPQTQEWRAAACTYLYNMFAKESPLLIDLHVHILLETIEWLIWIWTRHAFALMVAYFWSNILLSYLFVTEESEEAVCTQMDMEMSTSSQQKKFSRVQMETSLSPQILVVINK